VVEQWEGWAAQQAHPEVGQEGYGEGGALEEDQAVGAQEEEAQVVVLEEVSRCLEHWDLNLGRSICRVVQEAQADSPLEALVLAVAARLGVEAVVHLVQELRWGCHMGGHVSLNCRTLQLPLSNM
jgi:glutathione S-transferase